MGSLAALPFLPRSAEAAAALGESVHARLARSSASFRTLDGQQQALVAELCDRILPETKTPGALAVRVPEFIDLLLTDHFDAAERDRFIAGLGLIDARARGEGGRGFAQLAEPAKLELMRALDSARNEKEGAGPAFGRLKSLTVFAYFTSERVTKEVLETQLYFPKYDGCAPVSA
jgi:hypothetical protein